MNSCQSLDNNYLNKWILLVVTVLMLGLCSCGKSGDGGGGTVTPPPVIESPIVFTISPDPGSTIFPALGASQDFTISITSKLPTSGVKIDLSLIKDLDGSSVFSQSLNSSISNLTATFQNLTSGIVCSGTIKITSLSTSTNSATKTFKIAKK